MRKIIEEIRGRCEAFLGQREDLVWVVRAGLSEYMALTSILDSLEKEESPDAFWIFADAFESRGAYVEAVLGSFEARCALMNEKLTEMGEPPLTPTPGEVKDPKQEPIARMRALMVHARNLIPDVEASHLVWGSSPPRFGTRSSSPPSSSSSCDTRPRSRGATTCGWSYANETTRPCSTSTRGHSPAPAGTRPI